MASEEEQKQSPQERWDPVQNGSSLFSPRFKSVAAMAGWDEESIMIASLTVDDTPDREKFGKQKKRSDLTFKTPPSNSRRKRRANRRSPISIPVPALNLEEEEPAKEDCEKKKPDSEIIAKDKEKKRADEPREEKCSSSVLPCIDKLREELSCAICLEICFEPSTTSCGHSFCKKCLRNAADKCGRKCPKCRQLISNGRSCTVNTVLWNTIQLLFPQEVEARKVSKEVLNSREAENRRPGTRSINNVRNRGVPSSNLSSRDVGSNDRRRAMSIQVEDSALGQSLRREDLSMLLSRDTSGRRRRRGTPSQDEDAALALRLQREEFMEAFRGSNEQSGSSVSLARANLRAMASRAINNRMRDRHI